MKWPFYRLMKKEEEGGDPGGGGKPPADPPEPKKGEGGGEPPEPPGSVPVDVLPEELRNRPAAEQKFILEQMVNSLATRGKQVEDLQTQVAELRGAVGAKPEPPKEPDPHEGKPLEELILEDTENALDRYMKKRGYVKAFTDLTGRVDSAEFTMARAEIDDFDEYEQDVNQILKEGNLAPTRQNVRGAYTMVVGQRALSEKEARSRGGGGTIPPSNPPADQGGDDKPKFKSDLEREIAAAHGVSDPEVWYENVNDKPMSLKLPT